MSTPEGSRNAERTTPEVVRGGPPRVFRSGLSGTWYVVSAYRVLQSGLIEAITKREIHEDDSARLDRLRAIEAAARAIFTDGPDPGELPDEEWEPTMLALRAALERTEP